MSVHQFPAEIKMVRPINSKIRPRSIIFFTVHSSTAQPIGADKINLTAEPILFNSPISTALAPRLSVKSVIL